MTQVLVIGAGSIGERHLRCFLATQRVSASLCETDEARCRDVAARYGVTDLFFDFEAAVKSAPAAAVICTPSQLHVAMATRLANAGVHLLIEKPLGISLDGVDALCETVAAQRIVAAVGYVWRAHPALSAMRQAIGSGRFGRPVQLIVASGQHFPTYRPAYRSIYYVRHDRGGGAIQDALTHMINAGEYLVGPIARVMADASHLVLEGVEVEDTVHVVARHESEQGVVVLGSYSLNQYQAPNESTLTVVCERGTARFESHNARWRWMTEPGNDWHDEPECSRERDAMFLAQAHAFIDAFEGKGKPLCTLAEGVQTLRVNLALLEASRAPAWTNIAGDQGRRL